MNLTKYIFTALILLSTSSNYADPTFGFLSRMIQTDRTMEIVYLPFLTDWQDYTAGGITFLYPPDLFATTPIVQVSLKQIAAHPSTETYTAEIVSTSPTSTTIMVYNITAGIVSEATTGSITVCLLAIDNPT